MKPFPVWLLSFGVAVLTVSGCSKKDVNSDLQKAAAAIAQPESAPASPAPEPPQPSPAQPATQVSTPPATPAQQMNQAMAAYKAGELEDAVVRLQKLRASPSLSPQKRIALNDAIASVMNEIYALAQKGDARAVQALKTYEQLQTRPR